MFSSFSLSNRCLSTLFNNLLTFQIEEFRRLRTYHKEEIPVKGEDGCLADNFRPTQPVNDRVIKASFQ